jgi:hypothetical protein
LLHVIVDDPADVARYMVGVMEQARDFRRANSDSYNYNWLLKIPPAVPASFEVTPRVHARLAACIATSRRTSSPRICGARSPGSSPAT